MGCHSSGPDASRTTRRTAKVGIAHICQKFIKPVLEYYSAIIKFNEK